MKKSHIRLGAKAVSSLIAASLFLTGCGADQISTAIVSPKPLTAVVQAGYPDMPPYPNETEYIDGETGEFDSDGFYAAFDPWWEAQRARRDQPEGYDGGLDAFWARSARQFLSGGETYSPLNVYMALGMLAELTDGRSRQQILDLLGRDSLEDLRTQARALWKANYCDDGATATVLASSLWLDKDISFVKETLETLAETYHASSYQGEMGSPELDQALRDWLDQQTGGLLKEQSATLSLEPETVLALAATVYFRAKWSQEFSESQTAPDTFHARDGDMTCDFMHQSSSGSYYWGDRFSAVGKSLENEAGSMWFLLPDEGVSPQDLLADDQAMSFLLHGGRDWENEKYLIVDLSLPKFDVSSDLDLREGLQALGVTDVFDLTVSDFSPMTKDLEQIYLSQAKHAARVAVDEEGVTAASYTVMAACGSGEPPEDRVSFTLDRPFLFSITGIDGTPLFLGVVERP